MFLSEDPAHPICSAKGCRAEPGYVLVWNNPKLHTPDRRKTWLACAEHREHLGQFLAVRGFLKDTVPFAEWTAQEGGAQDARETPGAGTAANPGADTRTNPGTGTGTDPGTPASGDS